MTYSFRKAEQADRDAIYRLYCLVMRILISRIWGWNEQWQENDFSEHFDANNITLVYKGVELVGYSHVENRDDQLYIRMIIVHPHYQGKGIGTELLVSVIKHGKLQSKSIGLEVFKSNNRAKEFYIKYGFIIEGETPSSYVMSHA